MFPIPTSPASSPSLGGPAPIQILTPIEIRQRLGLSRRHVAAKADVCDLSVKAYELNPSKGVTAPIRERLAPVYENLARQLAEETPEKR